MAHLFSAPARTPARRRWADDTGMIVVGTLTKVLLVLGVLVALGYDAVALSITHVSINDQAQAAAQVGHDVLHDKKTPEAVVEAVQKYAATHGDKVALKGVTIGPRNTVTVTLTRDVPTVVAHYLPKVNELVVASGTGTATDQNLP